jgi:hypothetical protein
VNAAQLYAWYFKHPPKAEPPLEPVHSDATTQVIPYTKWIKLKCVCCDRHGVSGLWRCEFSNSIQPMLMCAACAFNDAFRKWNGFYSKHLLKVDLMVTLTYPSRTETQDVEAEQS